jgi:hypothetical protein
MSLFMLCKDILGESASIEPENCIAGVAVSRLLRES